MNKNQATDDDVFNAFAGAVVGDDIAHYPVGQDHKKIEVRTVLSIINEELNGLEFKKVEDAEYHLEQAKTSYEEVKAATEYQDQKTARLLTIMAFLTAAAGTVFGKVIELFPLHQVTDLSWRTVVVSMVYILFVFYFLMVASGALISFYAMQTRFVTTKEADVVSDRMRSILFFKYIAGTNPKVWAKSFNVEPLELVTLSIKHYIAETYLIATKASDKVRYLQPAQNMLQNAIKVLIAWVIILVLAAGTAPMYNKDSANKAPTACI